MTRLITAWNLPRAYFSAIIILVFGACCFTAGVWTEAVIAAEMVRAAVR